MLLRAWIAGLLLAAATVGPSTAREADSVEAVEPGGPGVLTKCRDWLVYQQCGTYHHIALPNRIAVGDSLNLSYGSNPKEYVFRVQRIRHRGDGCILFNEEAGGEEAERLEITPCRVPSSR